MAHTPLSKLIHPFQSAADLDALLEELKGARIVMLGEASHGTHEYYTWRMALSRRLIAEQGFNFIAVEGDWPDCYSINRYVKQYPDSGSSAQSVISRFDRWPSWMWSNWEMVGFTDWLRQHNQNQPHPQKAGFYGLDVYSLWESLDAIMEYLEKEDPAAAQVARTTINCLEPYRDEEGGIAYARAQRWMPHSCEKEVVELLGTVRAHATPFPQDPEGAFSAEQNARIAVNAEKYYRIMIEPGPHSWNLRDEHMMDTLTHLLNFYGPESRAIVWAHNTHIGDARYTDMAAGGLWNIGQLARQQYGQETVKLIGFGSYTGTVTAGRFWGAPVETMELPPARAHSWEQQLEALGGSFYLLSDEMARHKAAPQKELHRAVGVVYNPERERHSNYVPSYISKRYDAFMFLRESRALHPLSTAADVHKAPDTYPWAF